MRYALVAGGSALPPPEAKAWQAGAGQGSKVDIARIRYLEVWQFQGCC